MSNTGLLFIAVLIRPIGDWSRRDQDIPPAYAKFSSMGIAATNSKNNLALKLLSLNSAEIEELLLFLFRKLHYRIEATLREGDLLYFHLVEQREEVAHHALACWTGGKRIMAPDFLQSFLKSSPFPTQPGAQFERGFFLSPFDFASEFKTEAERNGINLVSGEVLSNLLVKHELTYYFPSLLESIGRHIWKKLPIYVCGLLIFYGFFLYQTMKPHHGPTISVAPSPAPTATEPSPAPAPQVSLLTPGFAVHIETPDELYKRIETSPAPIPIEKPKPAQNEVSQPPQYHEPTPPPPQRPPPQPPITHRPALRPTQKTKGTKQVSSATAAYKIINKYNRTIDLEEKYFSIARDLDKKHFNAKAKAYYQKYLQVAPEGDYADQAREALKRL